MKFAFSAAAGAVCIGVLAAAAEFPPPCDPVPVKKPVKVVRREVTVAVIGLERPLFPHGTTIISTAFQVAGCIGSSLFMGILSGVQAGRVAGGESMAAATAAGFHAAALVAAGIAVVALVLAFRLARIERLQLRDRADGVREAAAEPFAEPAVAAAAQESGVLVD